MSRATIGFWAAGLLLAGLWWGMDLAGWRDCVSVLSGTVCEQPAGVLKGLGYTAAWFAAILLAPILLLAGVLRALLQRLGG